MRNVAANRLPNLAAFGEARGDENGGKEHGEGIWERKKKEVKMGTDGRGGEVERGGIRARAEKEDGREGDILVPKLSR